MALDLSALDAPDERPDDRVGDGKPLRAPLAMFYEDPDQPRKEVDPVADARDREDIQRRGVLQAITVAPPDADGRMRIIFGARRWRLSCEAGLADIPYVMQEDAQVFDDYAQVAENERRSNLTPLDLAQFIAKRKKLGDKNAYIAKQIGISKTEVTEHLVLIEGPAYIRSLYTTGKCRTPRYLYDLMSLAKGNPEAVEQFCRDSDDFTRKSLAALAASIRLAEEELLATLQTPVSQNAFPAALDQHNDQAMTTVAKDAATSGLASVAPLKPMVLDHAEMPSSITTPDSSTKDSTLHRPQLMARYQGHAVTLMLYRRPTEPGRVFIQQTDHCSEIEVSFDSLRDLVLTETGRG